MAIRGVANRVLFNEQNHSNTNPVVNFQSLDENSHFSFCFWLKPLDDTNYDAMFAYNGTNGAQIIIGRYLGKWFVQFNGANGVAQSLGQFETAAVGRWTLICFSFSGRDMLAYTGHEDVPSATTPVTVFNVGVGHVDDNLSIPFSFLHVASSHNTATCNLKYWNRVLTMAEFTTEGNKWVAGDAMWASTLRTPGDISSIAQPNTTPFWYLNHGYELEGRFIQNELEIYEPDPLYLSGQPCPTWIYPIISEDSPIFIDFNPGVTPLVPTTYKSTKFWQFEDRGSIPRFPNPNNISVVYHAYPFSTDSGIPKSDSWPLIIDSNGAEINTDVGNPTNQFESNSGVAVPGAITALDIYQWQFGGQFTWQAHLPTAPTATANLGYGRLFVTYTGIPNGDPTIPADLLTGLFVTNKGGKPVDRYNRGIEVKIPNPTIRTAFIGE